MLVEEGDEPNHKQNCEWAFTLLHENVNLILNIWVKTSEDDNNEEAEGKPVTVADFDTEEIEKIGDFKFDVNSVPFDFDGTRLLYMDYKSQHNWELTLFHTVDQT